MRVIILFGLLGIFQVEGNDFPSFLTTNASLAVVVDHTFLKKRNEDIFEQVQKIIEDTIRENLRHKNLNVRYYSWGAVRLKKDFFAAITVMDCERTWKLFETAEKNSIFLFGVTDPYCPRLPPNKALMVPLISKGEEAPQMILDIKIQRVFNWKSCAILYDSTVEDKITQIITSMVHEGPKNLFNPISIQLRQIQGTLVSKVRKEKLRSILSGLRSTQNMHYIVYLTSLDDIIDIASSMKMFNVFNQWVFFIQSPLREDLFENYLEIFDEGANVVFALNNTNNSCEETLICNLSELFLAFVTSLEKVINSETVLYNYITDEEWESIRLTKSERQLELLAHIKDFLQKNSKCSGCIQWKFKSIESWGRSKMHRTEDEIDMNFETLRAITVGNWKPMRGYIPEETLFPNAHYKFRNITLNILTYHNPPWQILETNEMNEVEYKSGLVIDVLDELSIRLNFSYRLKNIVEKPVPISADGSMSSFFGSRTNNVPQKLITMLRTGKYFMAAVGATIDEVENVSYEFSLPVSVQSYTFISKSPEEQSRIYLFMAPFTGFTWLCLIGAMLLVAPVLCIFNKYGAVSTAVIPGLSKVANCFWYIYGALLQQGGLYLPKMDSGRLIVGVWWIAVIVLVTTYCGNLVAFLTFPRFKPAIEYLSQGFSNKDVKYFGLRNDTFFEKYTQESSRDDFRNYIVRAIRYNDLDSEDIEAVRRGERINLDWKVNLQHAITRDFENTQKCDFILAKESFVSERIGLIFPEKSPYLELINKEIDRLLRMGLIERWNKKYFPFSDKCDVKGQNRQVTNHMVNLKDMQGSFLVLLLGFSFGVLVILFEIWYYRLYRSKKREFSN